MTETYTFKGTEYTYDDLLNLSGEEQVTLFNELSDEMGLVHALRFQDKQAGATRVYARLKEYGGRLTKKEWPDDRATGTEYKEPIPEEVATAEADDSVAQAVTSEGAAAGGQGPGADPPAQAPSAAPPARRKRQKYFNFPASDDGVKTPRTGSLRDRVLSQLTTNGLTFEEVVELVRDFDQDRVAEGRNLRGSDEHQERRAYEILRIVHYNLGYGMRHDQTTGKITVFKK